MLKRMLKSDGARKLASWLGVQYIRLVWLTGRWTVENGDIPGRFWSEGRPFILAFWHGNLLMMPKCWDPAHQLHMLTSQHRDGQIIGRVISAFGIEPAYGSSTRGGSGALRQALKALKASEYAGFTPDGPRGPRMRAQPGVVNLAKMSGVPIIPCAYSCATRKILKSWDLFQVPLPFTRGLILWGEPIEVPRDLDDARTEAMRLHIEDRLTAIAHDAEARFGHPPTQPALPGPPATKRSKSRHPEPGAA